MADGIPFEISLWRFALGLFLGAVTTITLTCFSFFGSLNGSFFTMAGIVAVIAGVLFIAPFLVVSLRRGALTASRALVFGGLLTGLPTFLYAYFVLQDISGVEPGSFAWFATVLWRTVWGAVYGVAGTAVAWVTAIGFLKEPPRKPAQGAQLRKPA